MWILQSSQSMNSPLYQILSDFPSNDMPFSLVFWMERTDSKHCGNSNGIPLPCQKKHGRIQARKHGNQEFLSVETRQIQTQNFPLFRASVLNLPSPSK